MALSLEEIKLQFPEDYERLFDFSVVSGRTAKIASSWDKEIDDTKTRRNARNIRVDIDTMRSQGKLKPDEVLIPIRIISENITREKPAYVAYIKQSRRLAIFKCKSIKNLNTEKIEEEFSAGMRFNGWELPFIKCLDGGQLHGWDSIEVEYDESKPLHVGISHVGHDRLIWDNQEATDLQDCEEVFRIFDNVSVVKLQSFVDLYQFNPEQVKLLLDKAKISKESGDASGFKVKIYKRMNKFKGCVYVSWLTSGSDTTDWLKAPQALYLGRDKEVMTMEPQTETMNTPDGRVESIQVLIPKKTWEPIYEDLYPFKIFKYTETEESEITSYQGRGFFDLPKQEAQTALWSLFINGSVRASNVYGSPKNSNSGGVPKVLEGVSLQHGCLYTEPIEFWNTNFPDPSILRATDALDTRTQVETGQTAFAVINREDSRKTAKEITSAENQAGLLNSVQVTMYSTFIRDTLAHCWLIVQSQALQEKIEFLQIPVMPPGMGGGVPQMGNMGMGQSPMMPPQMQQFMNDKNIIMQEYEVYAAGDVDVIQRAEKLNRRSLFNQVVAPTPAGLPFLIDMLQEAFPEDAPKYIMALSNAAMQQQLLPKVFGLLLIAVTDENQNIKPEFKQFEPQILQIKQMVDQTMGIPYGATAAAKPRGGVQAPTKDQQGNMAPKGNM